MKVLNNECTKQRKYKTTKVQNNESAKKRKRDAKRRKGDAKQQKGDAKQRNCEREKVQKGNHAYVHCLK